MLPCLSHLSTPYSLALLQQNTPADRLRRSLELEDSDHDNTDGRLGPGRGSGPGPS